MTHKFGSTVSALILDHLRRKLDCKYQPARFVGVASGGQGYLVHLPSGHLAIYRYIRGFDDNPGDHLLELPFLSQKGTVLYSTNGPENTADPEPTDLQPIEPQLPKIRAI